MNSMKYVAPVLLAMLMLPGTLLAGSKNEHSVQIPDSVLVGKTQLQPGTYKVEWHSTGSHVQVTFLRGKKVVTTVPATIKTNDSQIREDDVILDHVSGNRKILREIDFGHGKEAVILNKSA